VREEVGHHRLVVEVLFQWFFRSSLCSRWCAPRRY
jgi:hypothetical protein